MITPVLPINQSDLETKVALAVTPLPRLAAGVELIRTGKRVIPDDLVPWLIWEYGLDELIPWLKDPRRAIREGVKWQRQRGTRAALKTALGWIDFVPSTIEETEPGLHFAEFEMDLGRVPESRQLAQDVLALARLSAPVRSRLTRVYHGYDVRRFILDQSDWGDLLDGESGVFLDGMIQSFGRRSVALIDTTAARVAPGALLTRLNAAFVPYIDRLLLDYWRFGEDVDVINHGSARFRVKGYSSPPLDNPAPIGQAYTFVKAQIVLDDDGYKLGDTNACFPVSTTKEIGQTFILGQDRLDEHIWAFQIVPVFERFDRDYSAVNATPYQPQTQRPSFATRNRSSLNLPLAPVTKSFQNRVRSSTLRNTGRTWKGGTWDTNTWRSNNVLVGTAHSRELANLSGFFKSQVLPGFGF